ncbi:MAG: ATP-binding cassette domain-containing protein, partial [Anaerolineae bacterium]|nr:ATP-binding cassette domain-containing protein [Anaerolineae bacterium]
LDSTNGTFVNGVKVQHAQLKHGDVLRIGDPQGNSVGITFRSREQAAAMHNTGAMPIDAAHLDMSSDVTIGRDPTSKLHLDGPIVSWKHAVIVVGSQGHTLHDLNSTNGTFVNGQRIQTPHFLRKGDEIQIGPYTLIYEESGVQQYEAAGGVRLDGVNVTREVGHGENTKRILNNISISVFPREFISLVGTSGAGKSTFMKALSGVTRAEYGQVLVNGDNLYEQFDLYRTLIGYVPQDDILHRDLKVGDALRYSARLRLPPDTSSEEIEARINSVLEEVEMVAQKDQVISSLSGGQRKRVSIASELLAEPRLFFLDEPTSGLDPGLEKKMMYTLRRLADAGRTIVLVTHATANITQCDHVCFLSQGRMTYYGPPSETFDFFGVNSGDFSDVYDKLDDMDPHIARQQAARWEEQYHQSTQYQKYVSQRQQSLPTPNTSSGAETLGKRPKVNLLQQLLILTRRYLDLVFKDKALFTVLMVVMPLIAAFIVLVADSNWLVGDSIAEINRQLAAEIAQGDSSATYTVVGDSQTLLFNMSFASILLGLFASVYEIVKEWSVYQRERMVTLRILPYILSKVIVMGIFALLQCYLFMFVIGLKVDFPTAGVILPAFFEMYITLVLGTIAAILLGLLISAIVPNPNTVIYLVFVTLMIQMIFAGVMFDLPGISSKTSVLTLTRWSVEALGASANVDYLNQLTQTRFQPDPVTEEVTTEVEKPSDTWEPVTVITKTQEITVPVQPGIVQTVPISVPEVIVNDMITEMATITETFTVTPESMDIQNELEFQVDYSRSAAHLLKTWSLLVIFGVAFGLATAYVLRRKDIK